MSLELCPRCRRPMTNDEKALAICMRCSRELVEIGRFKWKQDTLEGI
jgi:predicted amidophosphoribosyltransferase